MRDGDGITRPTKTQPQSIGEFNTHPSAVGFIMISPRRGSSFSGPGQVLKSGRTKGWSVAARSKTSDPLAHLAPMMARPLLCILYLPFARSAVVKDIWGANRSELLYASSGGGTHVYLSGADIGSAFAPPTILMGQQGKIACNVQPFTSAKNRMHCIISGENAPAPLPDYHPSGQFVSLPIMVVVRGRPAECWHEGKVGADCQVRFDIGGSPRVLRVLTQTVESAGTLRLSGKGIDGGLRGAQRLAATLYRGAVPVLGACGEKDCQASNMGAETLGCYSRPDAGGDGVSGGAQDTLLATSFSDTTRFGCVLDRLAGGLPGGFFNISLSTIADEQHRGNAYLGFLATKLVDVSTGMGSMPTPMRTSSRVSACLT